MKKPAVFSLITAAFVLIAFSAQAEVTIPNTFSSNTPAIADSVNENFNYLGSVMPSIASSVNLSNITLTSPDSINLTQ